MKFVFQNNEWWQVHDFRGYGRNGKVLRIDLTLPKIEAEGWTSLDWSCLLKRNSEVGWIAPDGTWFGCDDDDIDDVAKLFLKTSETALEHGGWVKIYQSLLTRHREWYSRGMQVNKKQALILRTKGFVAEDWQIIEEK